MAEGYGSAGQSAPKQRQGGQWVEVEPEQGVGPQANGDSDSELAGMKRAELDAYARGKGLDPDEYGNMADLRKALES